MKRPSIFLLLILFLVSCNQQQSEILVEAESFSDKGGWLVDPQFVEQMGSPYLLAHGLGNPVGDASTQINLAGTGQYHVWVRTRNWVPGPWEAPGRFRIAVNDKELETVLGTEEGWAWQYAGHTAVEDSIRQNNNKGYDRL